MYVFPHCVLKGTTYIFLFENFLSTTQNLQKVWDQINVLHVSNRSHIKWDINCFYWHYSLFYFNLVLIICLGHMGERCWRSFSHRYWLEQNSRPSNPFCYYYCCFRNIYRKQTNKIWKPSPTRKLQNYIVQAIRFHVILWKVCTISWNKTSSFTNSSHFNDKKNNLTPFYIHCNN